MDSCTISDEQPIAESDHRPRLFELVALPQDPSDIDASHARLAGRHQHDGIAGHRPIHPDSIGRFGARARAAKE
jgi:hypothetical protein